MSEKFRVFLLLLRKNFLVRKRHWIQSALLQIIIPIGLATISLCMSPRPTGPQFEDVPNESYYETIKMNGYAFPKDLDVKYTPSNNITDKIMIHFMKCLDVPAENVESSPNETIMVKDFSSIRHKSFQTNIGIVFEAITDTELPKLFKYKLRTSDEEPRELFYSGENGDGAYRRKSNVVGEVALCLDKAYIKQVAPSPKHETIYYTQQIPYPAYKRLMTDPGLSPAIGFAMGFGLAFLVVSCVEVTYPANEKFIGINVLMSVNGISNRLNLLSWLVSASIWSTSYLIPTMFILKYFHLPGALPFLLNSNAFIVWIALSLHVFHLITFSYHLTSYFWKPFRGIIVIIILTNAMGAISSFIKGLLVERSLLYLGILSPNFIFRRIGNEIIAHEAIDGVTWSNLFTSGSDAIPEGSIGVMIVFSIIGILFHYSMTVYVYSVRPGKYGVPRHPFYFFQSRKRDKVTDEKKISNFECKEFEHVNPGSLQPGIQIRGLKKVYTTDLFRQMKVNALRGVSMDIYKSQITALLGHNGAGKTTMMSILSGLTDATEGAAFIEGNDILNETNTINNNIGLCPQENMLFPDLTVHQQLMLFGMIKANNKTRSHLEIEVRTLLNKVNLTEKTDSYAAQLSGGQKRRLCLALAIIGDAKVLILDEPTSGMDAESKREVWDILLKMRGEKTILISTHDMEEADILGDRIAIMHTGKLRSYGTSMFLKKLYGDGQVEITLSVEPWCEITKISEEIGITSHILYQDDGKIVLALPPAQLLPVALDKLENSKKKLGITGMSVSIITLEQVFMRVTKDEDDDKDSIDDIEVYQKVTGFPYYLQTLTAFLSKKFKYARKNPWNVLISMILPCIPMLISIAISAQIQFAPHQYTVSLGVYPDTKAFVQSDKPLLSQMYLKTINHFNGIATEVDSDMSVTDALINYARKDKTSYQKKVIVSAEFNTSNGDVRANGFYSGDAIFANLVTVNCMTNTIVKALTGDEEYEIQMSMHELPYNHPLHSEDVLSQSVGMSQLLLIFLAPAMALYVIQPLDEIVSGMKQLQIMTGAPKSMYWAGTFLYDFTQYILSIVLSLVLFIIIDTSLGMQMYYGTEISIMFGFLSLFGISVLPLIYLCTFIKRSSNVTIIILTIVPIVLVWVELILFVLTPGIDHGSYRIFREIQSKIFLFVPHVHLVWAQVTFATRVMRNAHCRRMSRILPEIYDCKNPISYLTHETGFVDLQHSLMWLGITSMFYSAIVFILEQGYFEMIIKKIRGNGKASESVDDDEIVKEEKQIVNEEIAKLISSNAPAHQASKNIFLVQELRKNYGELQAVKGISFRVKESECFGLLGVNGAGKSTTFKMLTGDILPSSGTVYLKKYNNSRDRSNYLSLLGYCPQQDAIIPTLNTWDHLYLFARLRGIPSSQVPGIVKQWITKLNLTPCANQPSGTYSGGNKRRLNIALALIGDPPLVLMDEPTTGVDPAARRSLWNTLKTCQNAGQSIILTSHSMEECEALCNRLVIMVGGRIVCVGASEELKQRFGSGYNIHIKLSSTQQVTDVDAIKQRIISVLNCSLTDHNTGFLGYHVIDPNATWTMMYSLMDDLKNQYECIESYVVLSSTLEQLFIQFARATNNRPNNRDNLNVVSPV